MKSIRIISALGLLVMVAAASGCDSKGPEAVSAASLSSTESRGAAPAKLTARTYLASGPLVVENQVDVAAQRQGIVARVLADVGAPVRKGQLLAQLDDRQLAANRDAAVAKAKSVEQDEKNWETEIKIVEADLSRDEELFKYKLITEQQLEHSRYKLIGARQQREREEQSTKEAKAQVRALELELEKTRIVAPFDGVVARRYVRVGQEVAANDRLFWVTATSPLNVRFTLPQELASKVRQGNMLSLFVPGNDRNEHSAKVTLVSPVVDPSSGTIEVQAQVVGKPGELRPGMTVNIQMKNP